MTKNQGINDGTENIEFDVKKPHQTCCYKARQSNRNETHQNQFDTAKENPKNNQNRNTRIINQRIKITNQVP